MRTNVKLWLDDSCLSSEKNFRSVILLLFVWLHQALMKDLIEAVIRVQRVQYSLLLFFYNIIGGGSLHKQQEKSTLVIRWFVSMCNSVIMEAVNN